MNKTEETILAIMRHFDIPPRTYLQGVIEEECDFEVWADHNDQVFIRKTKDWTISDDGRIYIISRPSNGETSMFDDEDEWFPE